MKMTGVLLLAVVLWAGCHHDDAAAVPTITVQRNHFARTVTAEGYLKPVQTTQINAPYSQEGPMRIAWLAEDGAVVKKDEVVARFDDSELRTRLLAVEDDKTTAATKRQKEGLLVSQARSERQRTTIGAERELTSARTFPHKDKDLYSRDDIITAEIDEKLQTARAETARRAEGVDGQVARRKIQMLEVEGRKADESISRVRTSLQQLEARAPHEGVLLFNRNFRGEALGVGDQAWGPIAELSASRDMEAEVFVLEVEAAGLAKGKKAELTLDSHPGVVVPAQVVQVSTVAKRRQFRSPTQYFGVTLSLSKVDPSLLRAGQRVRATLLLDERDAIVVPRPALFDREKGWVVYRREGNRFLPVPVKLGVSTAGRVAIEAGLAEGDVIALRDPAQSPDQILTTPVRARKGR
jgi:HlyD family secretion protein